MRYKNNLVIFQSYIAPFLFLLTAVSLSATLLNGFISATTDAATVKQISTGPETACAVANGIAKCWGANGSGQLGDGTTTNSSTPVAVSTRAEAIQEVQQCFLFFCSVTTPYQPASALAGKTVEKVSVGLTHACALANAQVYCWGDNSHGQLGNRSTTSTTIPVAVDVSDSNASAKSALAQKEIIDIAASEYFTCALASDGGVSCWGEGDNGRLGNNATTDSTYPQAIYSPSGSAFAGKKGVKLAKASGATMCVIAVAGVATSATGSPYCWGFGIDDGTALPSNGSTATACSKTSPTSRPPATSTTNTYIYQSLKPVAVPGATVSSVDGYDYMTGLANDGRAYYWGMYGHTETASYSNVTTCVVNPCTASVKIGPAAKITLALTSTQKKAKAANTGGGDKKTNLSGGNKATTGNLNQNSSGLYGVTTTTGGTYSTTGSNWQIVGNPATGYQTSAFTQDHYQGTAVPGGNYSAPTTSNVGNNKNGNSCATQTHYGYTKNAIYAQTGQKVATVPPTWPTTQAGITALSGNAYDGLFCAVSATAQCDAKGTSVAEGQTGSNYSQQCVTSGFIFTTTTCAPAPTGPQQVVATGWLAGKSVKTLDTGISGYTCAIANGSVGCWGLNSKGQLGNGTTTNKNVPTAVNL